MVADRCIGAQWRRLSFLSVVRKQIAMGLDQEEFPSLHRSYNSPYLPAARRALAANLTARRRTAATHLGAFLAAPARRRPPPPSTGPVGAPRCCSRGRPRRATDPPPLPPVSLGGSRRCSRRPAPRATDRPPSTSLPGAPRYCSRGRPRRATDPPPLPPVSLGGCRRCSRRPAPRPTDRPPSTSLPGAPRCCSRGRPRRAIDPPPLPRASLGCSRRCSRRLRTLPLLLPPAATATAAVAWRQPPRHLDPRPRRDAHHRDGPPPRCTVATVACGAPSAAPVVSPAPPAATSAAPAASATAPAAAGFLLRHCRHWSLAARPPLPSVAFCVPPRSCQLPSTILRYAARPLLHCSLFIECGGAYVGRARLRRMVLTAGPVLTVCG